MIRSIMDKIIINSDLFFHYTFIFVFIKCTDDYCDRLLDNNVLFVITLLIQNITKLVSVV